MTLNRLKLGRAVIFMKYLAREITFRLSNSPNLAKLVVNELTKSIPQKIYQYSFFFIRFKD